MATSQAHDAPTSVPYSQFQRRVRQRYQDHELQVAGKHVQALDLSKVSAMKSKDICNMLGLAHISGNGRCSSAHPDTANMLAFITGVAHELTLPLDGTKPTTHFGDQTYLTVLEDQIEAVLSKFGFIWGRGSRRSSTSDLYVDVPEDLSRIKEGLRAYLMKRAINRRVVARRAGSEVANTIDAFEDDEGDHIPRLGRGSSYNYTSPSSMEPDGAAVQDQEVTLASSGSRTVEDDASPAATMISSSDHSEPVATIEVSEDLTSTALPVVKQEKDAHSEIKPEKVWVLQQTAFDQLLAILQASNTQEAAFIPFDDHVRRIYGPLVHRRMQVTLGNERLLSALAAYVLWSRMHEELQEFRRATTYKGMADGWAAHKQTLRGMSWKEAYVPALNAHRQLGLFVVEMKARDEWPQTEDDFAAQLADYYGALLEAPAVQPEDLVDGFKEYNVELLAWFQIQAHQK